MYTKPQIRDHGDLAQLTAGCALGNLEDGSTKSVSIEIDPVADITLCVLPSS